MNEQLQSTIQEAAAKLIEKAMTGIDSATGFLQAEIPEYVYQLMLWYGVKSGVNALFSISLFTAMCVISVSWMRRFIKADNTQKNFFYEKDIYSGGLKRSFNSIMTSVSLFIVTLSIVLSSLSSFKSSILEVIQIWIAPKVWLVEYAATLVK